MASIESIPQIVLCVNNIQNNPQYQIQIDYVNTSDNGTGENNINNGNESDESDSDSDSDSNSSNNNNNNIQYSTDELYEMKSLGNIEMESKNNKLQKLELELEPAANNENCIENECEAEEVHCTNRIQCTNLIHTTNSYKLL